MPRLDLLSVHQILPADATSGGSTSCRCQDSTSRLSIKFRLREGTGGILQAFIIPTVSPKSCMSLSHRVSAAREVSKLTLLAHTHSNVQTHSYVQDCHVAEKDTHTQYLQPPKPRISCKFSRWHVLVLLARFSVIHLAFKQILVLKEGPFSMPSLSLLQPSSSHPHCLCP